MTIENIQSFCQQMPAVTQDIKWEHDLVFSVGAKMFCVVGLDQSPTSASFKVKDEEFEEMCNKARLWPGSLCSTVQMGADRRHPKDATGRLAKIPDTIL